MTASKRSIAPAALTVAKLETGAGQVHVVHVSGGESRHGLEVKPARRFRWSMQAEDRAAPCIASLVPLRC
ncbi:hypothetical protein NKH73_25015 [Mesorhizobium sp. M0938]|uniref:hypothetical protein n=1 Tax=unclassified Mesorhizobium TaxID=325217 RepID=UPI00333D3712